ncbi:hypothetical protein RvY_14997 [Ramazzottius varieornatus]|uniref:Rho-GAP domain-containing protein n=1 Tax=Ramazzottius varieornatus TaxID=947166 RepID=A0A1D1VUQ0_RAMVA|nr:hypothetical protein RvY_14997 [Ramazzottius varieornatus]
MSGLKFGRASTGTGGGTIYASSSNNGEAVTVGSRDKVFNIAVVGPVGNSLIIHHSSSESSGTHSQVSEDGEGVSGGPGKSCLCARFLRPAEDDYQPREHVSVLSAADFASPAINNDHFLYWGEAKRTSDDGQDCRFQLIEQTEFIDDSNFQPFRSGRGDKDYVRRSTAIKMQSPGKLQYFGRSQLGMEREFQMVPMSDGRFNVEGFVCTLDVSSSTGASCDGASSILSSATSKKALGSTTGLSASQSSQIETVFQLLSHIVRQKKPVVLAATKVDQASPAQLSEASKLLQRKELKGNVQLVETSAHRNVNVDAAFWLLAQAIERTRSSQQQGPAMIRYRLSPYQEAASMRKERMETAAKAFESLIRTQIKERKLTWPEAQRTFHNDQDFKFYCELWGTASAKKLFNSFMGQLRDREARSRLTIYLARLERIFRQLLTDAALVKSGWGPCLEYLHGLSDYDSYFADLSSSSNVPLTPHKPSGLCSSSTDSAYGTSSVSMASLGGSYQLDDDAFFEAGDGRVPSRLLNTSDAQRAFDAYALSVKRRERQQRLKDDFVALLKETPYALPGRSYRDLLVFLASEPGYTEELAQLNSAVKEEVYAEHQAELTQRAGLNFVQLLLENVSLFQPKPQLIKNSSSSSSSFPRKKRKEANSNEDREESELRDIEAVLRGDKRYRAMDLLAPHRHVLLTRMYRYYRSPFPEACGDGTKPCCDTSTIPSFIQQNIQRTETLPAFWLYMKHNFESSDSPLSVVLIGEEHLTSSFRHSIAKVCKDSSRTTRGNEAEEEVVQVAVDGVVYAINLPSFNPADSSLWSTNTEPFCHGCVCIYDCKEALEAVEVAIRASADEDGLAPRNGLPTMLVFAPASDVKETQVARLREAGQEIASIQLQCLFVELPRSGSAVDNHKEQVCADHLKMFVRQINGRINLARSVSFFSHPENEADTFHHDFIDCDIRLRLCVMCDSERPDVQSTTLSVAVGPFTQHVLCYQSPERSSAFLVETASLTSEESISDSGQSRIEVDCRSYHETIRAVNNTNTDVRNALTDGFILLLDLTTQQAQAAFNHAKCVLESLAVKSLGSRSQERACMIVAILHIEEDEVAEKVLEVQERLMEEVQRLCQERKVLLALCHVPSDDSHGSSLPLHTYTPLLQLCQQYKQRALMENSYDRASTATLNSTIPSLSDEEAVLINNRHYKSRSLDKKSPLSTIKTDGSRAYQRHGAFVNQVNSAESSGGEESPTFGTFGLKPLLNGRANTTATSFIHLKSSSSSSGETSTALARLTLDSSFGTSNGHLRASRSSEDILSTVQPTAAGPTPRPRHLSPAPPPVPPRDPSTVNHTGSVPSAWQARSTEETSFGPSNMLSSVSSPRGTSALSDKSSANRLVGRLTSGGRYTAFIDQLNANIHAATRGTSQSSPAPSPTAPLALPELTEDRVDADGGSAPSSQAWSASWQEVTDRHFLGGLKKKNKELKPPDRSAFRRIVAPKLTSDNIQHCHSFSHDTDVLSPTAETVRYPTRASLPDESHSRDNSYSKGPKSGHALSLLQSPLDDNVFFPAPPAAAASGNEDNMKNGSKINKSVKPKREKENKSSLKKSKEKKKKVERTFESFAQSPDNPVPLFVELCTKFIEAKGIETEGIYRVSGSRVHADGLLAKFLSNPTASLDLAAMDIPIYNVTTALKTFLTDHLPPLIPQSVVDELHGLAFTTDKAQRIHMVKCALAHLSVPHFQCLKYIFAHLQRIAQHSRQNKMDVHNLTVCLWPTLCPIELPQDMAGFEGIRMEVSEVLSTIISEHDRIFFPSHAFSPTSTLERSGPQLSTALAQEAAQAVRQRSVARIQPKAVPDTASSESSTSSTPHLGIPAMLHASSASLPGPSSSATRDALQSSLKSMQV